MIRILLVDDKPAVRSALRLLLDQQDGFEVVGEAQDGADAARVAQSLAPDVILMDVQMPELNGLESTVRILSEMPLAKVLGYSMNDSPQMRAALQAAGAVGLVAKSEPPAALIQAIQAVTLR